MIAKTRVIVVAVGVMACLIFMSTVSAQNAFTGDLKLQAPETPVNSGSDISVVVTSETKRGPVKSDLQNREVRFFLAPFRFSVLEEEAILLEARRSGDNNFTLKMPKVRAGWYLLYAQAAGDTGKFGGPGWAVRDKNGQKFIEHKVIAIKDSGPKVRVHTEHMRAAFSPGEMLRWYASSRSERGNLTMKLKSLDQPGLELTIAKATLAGGAGVQTIAFDLPMELTRAIGPGRWHIVAELDGKVADEMAVYFVNPERYGAGSRVYQSGAGTSSRLPSPWFISSNRGWLIDQVDAHRAEQWVHVFANAFPMGNPSINHNLPSADDRSMPPALAFKRPAYSYAIQQYAMSRGVGVTVMIGGWELGSENYMPTPMTYGPELDIIARKYLISGMSMAHYPNFTGLYTDAYARPAFWGAGELTGEETKIMRERLWREAWKYAGRDPAPAPPKRYTWDNRGFGRILGKGKGRLNLKKDVRNKITSKLKELKAQHGDLSKLPTTQQARLWKEVFEAGDVQAPDHIHYPMPKVSGIEMTDQERYRFTEYVQSGFGRNYGAITRNLEKELPAVFTVHNRRRENHRTQAYAWRDWSKSPSIPPEPSFGGPTVVFSSEFNLDQEPQPYSNPTAYTQSNRDKGQPVWASASGFQFAGSNSRFMRDAIHFLGRGVTPVYHNPKGWTWSHQGADQSTYAAYDRLNSVTHFLSMYEDLFTSLKQVKEVGIYIGPYWAGPNSSGTYLAVPMTHMTGFQGHVLSHFDADKKGFDQYKMILAVGMPHPPRAPHIVKAFKDFENNGGQIIGSVSRSSDLGHDVWTKFGIVRKEVPVLDDKGNHRKNKDGSPRMKTEWDEPMEQRAKAARYYIWKGFNNVEVAPIDFQRRWIGKNEDGNYIGWGRTGHWTAHHKWRMIQWPARGYHEELKTIFEKYHDPIVKKNEPEVFVSVAEPRDGNSKGMFLFAANFTIPKSDGWLNIRTPWLFYPTYALPVACEMKIKAPDTQVVYDLVKGKEIPFTREGDRIVFTADLGPVEGRVYALLPGKINSMELSYNPNVQAGQLIQPVVALKDASGQTLSVNSSVRIALKDKEGNDLLLTHRVIQSDGKLPVLRVPYGASGQLTLQVTDLLSRQQVSAPLNVGKTSMMAKVADPVTVYRGDQINQTLKESAKRVRVVYDDGYVDFTKEGERKIVSENPDATRDKTVAEKIKRVLGSAGISAEIVGTSQAYEKELWGYPFHGSRASYRGRHTMPNRQISDTVIFVGSAKTSRMLNMIDRYQVAPRSLREDNTSGGRAVIAYLRQGFSTDADAILIVADDNAGFDKASKSLEAILRSKPGIDPYYAAREAVRFQWLPADIARYKRQMNVLAPDVNRNVIVAGGTKASSQFASNYTGVEDDLGPAIFDLDAGPNGVVVGTKSLVRPLVLISKQGKILMSAGGGEEVMPRDVAISENGQTAFGGFALRGITAGYDATGSKKWETVSGIVMKDNPLSWDTWKNSERFIGISPDQKTIVYSVGPKGIQARDTNSGQILWTIGSDSPRKQGMSSPEIAVSPDSRFVLIKSDKKIGEEPEMRRDKPVLDENGNPKMKMILDEQMKMVDLRTGRVIWTAPANVSSWELYASVGPNAQWSITGGRDGRFAIRGSKGQTLRVVQPAQMPSGLRSRQQIPPEYLSTNNPEQLVIFAPQNDHIYLMKVRIGSPSEIARAEAAQKENKEMAAKLKDKLNNRKEYKTWSSKKVDAFMATIKGPEEAKQLITAKMKKVPGELRAKRKRDFRFFSKEFDRFKVLQYLEDKAIIEASAGISVQLEIDTPAKINHAVMHADGKTLYVSLWDHTVRAYSLVDGRELWKVDVVGGARLDFVEPNLLYVGGSRADLYQINANSGQVNWHVNLTGASALMVSE